MRYCALMALFIGCVCLTASGCNKQPEGITAPKNDSFVGKLVTNGKPVSFPPGEKVILRLIFSEKGESFGVPIKEDGSFTIGWMHQGKYSGMLEREKSVNGRLIPSKQSLPELFEIKPGVTEYSIELGPNFKP
jgi:hypothetical protein